MNFCTISLESVNFQLNMVYLHLIYFYVGLFTCIKWNIQLLLFLCMLSFGSSNKQFNAVRLPIVEGMVFSR